MNEEFSALVIPFRIIEKLVEKGYQFENATKLTVSQFNDWLYEEFGIIMKTDIDKNTVHTCIFKIDENKKPIEKYTNVTTRKLFFNTGAYLYKTYNNVLQFIPDNKTSDLIPSFSFDHEKLERGVYLSRVDLNDNCLICTYDIRMKAPYKEPIMDIDALHTMEHLAATFLRNDPLWCNKIIYWGIMGCCTGNYLIVAGKHEDIEIIDLMKSLFKHMMDYTGDIPGATRKACGNFKLNDLMGCKNEARKFYEEVLQKMENKLSEYPK